MNNNIKKIHLTGICGIAMGTLAQMLVEKGYKVTGSDENIYPPMSTILKDSGIRLTEGYSIEAVESPDLVIIGNAISRGNPEAEYVLNNRIPYMSMAHALEKFFLRDKKVITVCGTHGKSTTSALFTHILEVSGKDPSFFIGGMCNNFSSNYKLGSGRYFVVEGDEYDSAFFEKVPKFFFYKPYHTILTSLEFDHADIYNSIEEIELWFKRHLAMIPSDGTIVYNSRYENLINLTKNALGHVYSYGIDQSDFNFHLDRFSEYTSYLTIDSRESGLIDIESSLFGEFNFDNIAAAVTMAGLLGVSNSDIIEAVKTFQGVKRRQDLLYNKKNIKVYEDFAHHPTAVEGILKTMAERYPNAKIWALYEPRSATSRRKVFQNDMVKALEIADVIKLRNPFDLTKIPDEERIDVDVLIKDLEKNEKNASSYSDVDFMIKSIIQEVNIEEENVFVIMSNGGFDDIYTKLPSALDQL